MIKNIEYYLDEGAFDPVRAHEADAGLDFKSKDTKVLKPHRAATFDTGVHINIPKGYTLFLKSKSGLNVKYDIIGTGVIDAGYTGSIVVKLYNLGRKKYIINRGDKIIQGVLLKVETPALEKVTDFVSDASDRKDGGFGSTGK